MELRADRLDGLEKYFGRLTAEGKIPGYSAMVSQHGEVIYESTGGMANIAEGIPMTADSIFRTWSLSKPMTSRKVVLPLALGPTRARKEPSS